MRFTALPVHSFEDATLDLEQLQALLTTPGSSLPFLQLLSAQKLRLNAGSNAAVFAAQTNTPAVSISHGLGTVPAQFWAYPANGFGFPFWMQTDQVANWTSAVVPVSAFSYTALTATVAFRWLAIG